MRWTPSRAWEQIVIKAFALPFLLVAVLAGPAARQPPSPGLERDAESFHISMDVALVVLHATVTDHAGGFVSDLNQQNFSVLEDGKPHPIRTFRDEDVPVTVGLVVDHSSSMRSKLHEVMAAARAFVRSSNREDEMFVVNFNEHVSLGLPAKVRFSDSATQLEDAIAAAPPSGMTALYDAIARSLDELKAGSRDKKVLVVVSDGGDNASTLSRDALMKLAEQSNAVIYTIGIFDEDDPDRNPRVLRRLAEVTGGEAFLPGELSDIIAICERIARDIRHQYTIAFSPGGAARDGASHSIRVVAKAPGHNKLSVRTRTSYIADKAPLSEERP